MRAGPALPVGVGGPVSLAVAIAKSAPGTSGERDGRLTTRCAESGLGRGADALAGVGAGLGDDLVGGVLVGLVAVGVGDAVVEGVQLVAGAEGGPVVGVGVGVAEVLPAGRDAGGSARPVAASVAGIAAAIGTAVVTVWALVATAKLGRGGGEGQERRSCDCVLHVVLMWRELIEETKMREVVEKMKVKTVNVMCYRGEWLADAGQMRIGKAKETKAGQARLIYLWKKREVDNEEGQLRQAQQPYLSENTRGRGDVMVKVAREGARA